MKLKRIYMCCLVFLTVSCSDIEGNKGSKLSMSEFLFSEINSMGFVFESKDLQRLKDNSINNIIIGDADQAEVLFMSDDVLKYKIQSNYVILDSMEQANFLGEINLQIFNDIGIKTHDLFSEKAIVLTELSPNGVQKVLEKVIATDSNDKVKIKWQEENYILEADTIIMHYNIESDKSKYFEGLGNVHFKNEDTWMKGYRFTSDFNMNSWKLEKVEGEIKD